MLIDRLRLEEGDVTDRFEAADSGMLEEELVKLADELAERAEGREVLSRPDGVASGAPH